MCNDSATKECHRFPISLNKIGPDGYCLKRYADVDSFVCNNQICLGNSTTLSILANGDCTLCEMLYDNPEYIIGNINENSIYDIWNSKKAYELYSPNQANYNPQSPCSKCEVFDICKKGFGKRICYADINKIGETHHSPDPRCPLSKPIEIIL